MSMPYPFPGMNPYLEQPAFWSSVHSRLIVAIADMVAPQILPNYYIEVETRTYSEAQLPIGIEPKERYLEVREIQTNAVVTVIELRSPNHWDKRERILESTAHLIEIDLLRIATPMPLCQDNLPWDYRILVSRSETRPNADLYGFTLRERIPDFPLPLKHPGECVTIDLQTILQGVYDRAGYDYRIDYQQPVPPPTLASADQAWVTQILTAA
jgi:Protein of unknown function (DUF4058)